MWRRYAANQLLAALSQLDGDLLQWAQPVDLMPGKILQRAGSPALHLFFPGTALLSEQYLLADGHITEVGIIGYEGMTGLACCLNQTRVAPTQVTVIMAGTAYRLDIARIRGTGHAARALLPLLLASAYHNEQQLICRHACLQRHGALHRLSCWLLAARARVPLDTMHVTQSQIAASLGMRRETTTQAMGSLRELQVLRTGRSSFTILDNARLHAQSCDCVTLLTAAFERYLRQIDCLAQPVDRSQHALRFDVDNAVRLHQEQGRMPH